MIKGIKATMFLTAVLFPAMLFAGTAWADNVPGNRTIVRIFTYPNAAVIKYSPAFANILGCAGGSIGDTTAAISWQSDPDRKVMFASLLTALASNSQIGLGINGCFPGFAGPEGGIPLIYRVDVIP